MLRKRNIYAWLTAVVLAGVLSGCTTDEGSEDALALQPEILTVTPSPLLAEPETQAEIELLYNTGSLTEDEEKAVMQEMITLQRNLELQEYIGEGISAVSSQEWLLVMAPRLYEGSRTYLLQKDGKVLLSVTIGYDISNEPYTNVYCPDVTDRAMTLLKQASTVTQLIQAGVTEEGLYDGAFELWQADSETGELRIEQGTYAAGVKVGEYSVSVCSAQPGDAFDLWTNRQGFTYETTTETYDDRGELIPTPEPTARPTSKPSSGSKPSGTRTPATQPPAAQTVAPEQPSENPAQGGGNSGGSGSGGGDTGSQGSGGGDTGSQGSGGGDTGSQGSGGGDTGSQGSGGGDTGSSGSGGGDTDIEWSDDIL